MLSRVTEVRDVRSWRAHLVALGGLILVGIIGLVGLCRATDNLHTEQPQATVVVGELVDSASVGQTFEAEHPGLSQVEVRLATYERSNTGQLIFRLRSSGEDLVTRTLDAALIEDGAYHTFEFSPIRDSAHRSFRFSLESLGTEPGSAATVWGVGEDVYPDGEAVLERVDNQGVCDLTFRLGYTPMLIGRSKSLLDRLAANKPLLWKRRELYMLLGMVYVVLLYLLLLKVTEVDVSSED